MSSVEAVAGRTQFWCAQAVPLRPLPRFPMVHTPRDLGFLACPCQAQAIPTAAGGVHDEPAFALPLFKACRAYVKFFGKEWTHVTHVTGVTHLTPWLPRCPAVSFVGAPRCPPPFPTQPFADFPFVTTRAMSTYEESNLRF